MGSNRPHVSGAELEVLQVLWDHGPAKVRRAIELLQSRGRSWKYATVSTLLRRLASKGYVHVEKESLAHEFRASVSRQQLLQMHLDEIAGRFCGGAISFPIVKAVIEEGSWSNADIDQLRAVIAEMEKKSRRKGSARRTRGTESDFEQS